jgi:hypothetical protein
MTLFFPDVSNHNSGFDLSPYPAAIAKATEGTTFTDSLYPGFKAQAAALGIPFAAYHWLHAFDVPAQARHAFAVVGPNVPLMIDDEDTRDGLDLNRTLAFVKAYRALGGTVTLEYLPRWFWAAHGSPDLTPLAAAGVSLISSNYPSGGYSEGGPGWSPYGGVTPAIWQYTSTPHDMNAFKGTADQLAAVFAGTPEDDMALTNDEYNMIRNTGFLVTGLVNMEDPIVVPPNPASSYPGASLPNKLAQALKAAGVELTPEQLTLITDAAHDGAADGIDGATMHRAP